MKMTMSQMSTQMQSSVRILGIDPGYDRCGIAVIEKEGSTETLLFSECISTNPKESLPQRLTHIGNRLTDICAEYHPHVCAVENLFFNTNQTTAMGVAGMRGIAFFVATTHNAAVLEITPLQVKDAIVGYGRASKDQIQSMVPKLISIPDRKMLDDEIDAIAVALTASAIHRLT